MSPTDVFVIALVNPPVYHEPDDPSAVLHKLTLFNAEAIVKEGPILNRHALVGLQENKDAALIFSSCYLQVLKVGAPEGLGLSARNQPFLLSL